MKWLRVGGWAVLALVALWTFVKVVSIVLGVVSWVVSTLISLVLLALLVYVGYVLVSRFIGGSDASGGSGTRERERSFE